MTYSNNKKLGRLLNRSQVGFGFVFTFSHSDLQSRIRKSNTKLEFKSDSFTGVLKETDYFEGQNINFL